MQQQVEKRWRWPRFSLSKCILLAQLQAQPRVQAWRAQSPAAKNSDSGPRPAGHTLPKMSQNIKDALQSDFIHLFGSPRDSGPFKVKLKVPLQAHPTVPSMGKTRIHIQSDRRPPAQETHVLEMSSAIPNWLWSLPEIWAPSSKWICYRAGRLPGLLSSPPSPANHQQRLGGAQQ